MKKKDLEWLKQNNIILWYDTVKQRQYQRMHNLYQNITYWYHWTKYAYFITFTISNENLNLSKKTFTNVIKQTINSKTTIQKWIVNDDYSPKKERLHYHGILFSDEEIKKDSIKWKYGFVQVKPILVFNKKALGRYIAKLSHHALKEGVVKIIYSRNKKS